MKRIKSFGWVVAGLVLSLGAFTLADNTTQGATQFGLFAWGLVAVVGSTSAAFHNYLEGN